MTLSSFEGLDKVGTRTSLSSTPPHRLHLLYNASHAFFSSSRLSFHFPPSLSTVASPFESNRDSNSRGWRYRVIVPSLRPRLDRVQPRSFFVLEEKMHAREEKPVLTPTWIDPYSFSSSSSFFLFFFYRYSPSTCLLSRHEAFVPSFRSPPILFILLFRTAFLSSPPVVLHSLRYRTVVADRILPVFATPLYIPLCVSGSTRRRERCESRSFIPFAATNEEGTMMGTRLNRMEEKERKKSFN